ncbi:hypothetical protein [Salinimicrobium sp. GXAS 041]|uniref:hypothetical protein n=1 Tax=Salinimicrobium sp. GXAS 041 TaxID=3400806 RepID=UPI003C7840EB
MKKENKILLKTFFIAGLSFAIAMAFYGYWIDDDHLIWKFIIHFVLFGLTIGFLARRNYLKKQPSVENNEERKEDKKNID